MTKDLIDAEFAFDVKVAEIIFGWSELTPDEKRKHFLRAYPPNADITDGMGVPLYSSVLAAAWLVVEKLYQNNFIVQIETVSAGSKGYRCSITKIVGAVFKHICTVEAQAGSPALTICLAALEMMEKLEKDDIGQEEVCSSKPLEMIKSNTEPVDRAIARASFWKF